MTELAGSEAHIMQLINPGQLGMDSDEGALYRQRRRILLPLKEALVVAKYFMNGMSNLGASHTY